MIKVGNYGVQNISLLQDEDTRILLALVSGAV